jgi:hypothetical protein
MQQGQRLGAVLARHESDFRASAHEPLSLNDLLAMLGDKGRGEERSREDAIACFLSGSEGWDEAVKLLGGTFAQAATGLKERKED